MTGYKAVMDVMVIEVKSHDTTRFVAVFDIVDISVVS
jgi:hypothetical protein